MEPHFKIKLISQTESLEIEEKILGKKMHSTTWCLIMVRSLWIAMINCMCYWSVKTLYKLPCLQPFHIFEALEFNGRNFSSYIYKSYFYLSAFSSPESMMHYFGLLRRHHCFSSSILQPIFHVISKGKYIIIKKIKKESGILQTLHRHTYIAKLIANLHRRNYCSRRRHV